MPRFCAALGLVYMLTVAASATKTPSSAAATNEAPSCDLSAAALARGAAAVKTPAPLAPREGAGAGGLKTSLVSGSEEQPPHIVLVLFDDLGWHDLGNFTGLERHQCKAPVMDGLMRSGIKLTNFYAMPICSPTRAALMTGRYPIRYGGHVATPPGLAADQGWAPLGEPMLPERLREAGYVSKMSGKWHLGRSALAVTPTGRGFTEFYGKYEGGGDHWTHTVDVRADTRDGGVWPGHPDYRAGKGPLDLHHDRWLGPGRHSHQHIHTQNGTHSSDVIGREASRMVMEHEPSTPLFLYVAFQAPHWPVQNPRGTEERHRDIPSKQRRKWCGLVSHIDDNVGRIQSALVAKGMWDKTLFIAFSDNGGDVRTGASNHPYRGDKMTPWEGGTKTPTFIASPNPRLIDPKLRGTSNPALGHVTDLFPTLLGLAGGSVAPTSTGPLDGVDLWPAIGSGSPDSPRKEMLYNIDDEGLAIIGSKFFTGGSVGSNGFSGGAAALQMTRTALNGNIPELYGAIRVGQWKLVEGFAGRGDWYGTDPSPAWDADYIMGPDATDYDLLESGGAFGDMKLGDGGQAHNSREGIEDAAGYERTMKTLWLFDLQADPAEHNDLSAQMPEKVAELSARLATYRRATAPAIITEPDRWSAEERARIGALSKRGWRRVPGLPYVIADWWEDPPEGGFQASAPGGARSRL